jgi:outer membrane protein assembly factor BamA
VRTSIPFSRASGLLLAALLLPSSAFAQTRTTGSLRLAGVTFGGLQRFTESQVIAASGLRLGMTTDVSALAEAADRLAKNGAFGNVKYSYRTQGDDVFVDFDVAEAARFLPCIFDNFVWMPNEDLDRAVRDAVPLYDGTAPEGGTILSDIVAALQDLLKQKGIPGQVEHIPFAHADGHISQHLFRVTGVPLLVTEARFPGASKEMEPVLRDAARQLIKKDYSLSALGDFVNLGLLPAYHEHGYLRARFAPFKAELARNAPGGDNAVVVTLPVTEGSVYRWGGAEWAGNRQFSSDELQQKLGAPPGDIANQKRLDAGVEAVKKAYGARGFIEAQVHLEQAFDESASLVSYHVSIDEGRQFRMGTLTFVGFPESAVRELLKEWKLKPGDLFDASYINEFLQKKAGPLILKTGDRDFRFWSEQRKDKEKLTVDLQISKR